MILLEISQFFTLSWDYLVYCLMTFLEMLYRLKIFAQLSFWNFFNAFALIAFHQTTPMVSNFDSHLKTHNSYVLKTLKCIIKSRINNSNHNHILIVLSTYIINNHFARWMWVNTIWKLLILLHPTD
jgi:hypothetical protein